jgi:predicted ATP-dependent endonuclease of OLD family
MIFSLLIRNYKAYRGWSYIPITQGKTFTALIGENGIGKSSILEALDTYFNKPFSEWNYNHSISKSGFDRAPEICPIFLIEKSKITKSRNVYKYLETISPIMWQFEYGEYATSHKEICQQIEGHINTTRNSNVGIDENYFLFPCGLVKNSSTSTDSTFSIFANNKSFETDLLAENSVDFSEALDEIAAFISDEFEFIHIPSEIDYATYTKIEGKTIQALMGTTIDEIIKELIDDKVIKGINAGLDKFLQQTQDRLEKYEYKKPAQRQTLFNLTHLTSKIIETYFESKILNLKVDGNLTPINNCSSGEKRKAIIDLAHAFILNSERSSKNKSIILAVDEPESSLHTSSCFEQFAKLESISESNVQTIISTHWYGFFPSVSKGSTIIITESNREKKSHYIDLSRFREDIKHLIQESKGQAPSNIEIKSINDIIQSVISSVTRTKSNWLICEGISDKIYLSHFFKNRKDVYVISVGGSKYIKKFYEYIYLALDDNKDSMVGKIFLLLDTDKKFEKYNEKCSIKKLRIKRLQNLSDAKVTTLLNTSDNNFFPPTEIEDVLDPELFTATLKQLNNSGYNELLNDIVNSIKIYEATQPSGLAFDFRQSDKERLTQFFDLPHAKVEFAKRYTSISSDDDIPEWVSLINSFFDE